VSLPCRVVVGSSSLSRKAGPRRMVARRRLTSWKWNLAVGMGLVMEVS
jgi:hypothetical protein